MNKKPGLTIDQHQKIGQELKQINETLQRLALLTMNSYAKSSPGGKAGVELERARWRINEARAQLENAMYSEHIGQPGCGPHVY